MSATPIRPEKASDWNSMRGAATVAGAIAILYFARDTFVPLAFAVTLALILSAPVAWLQKAGLPRAPASLIVMTLALGLMCWVGYVVINQLVRVVNELPTYQSTISRKVKAIRKPSDNEIGRAAENVKALSKELSGGAPAPTTGTPSRSKAPPAPVPVQMVEENSNILTYFRDLMQPFIQPLAMLGVVLVVTVFLLIEHKDVRNRMLRLVGVSHLNLMTQAADDAVRRISRYLLLQFAVNAGFGALVGVGLSLIGLPYAALWGGVAALLRIIPYVGSIVAGLLPIMLCLAVFDGWRQPVLVFLLFGVLELVTANFLEPMLYGAHTGISSLALLLTTIFWTTLWGPPGLILSTPLTVCVVVLGRHIKHLSFLHVLLGDEAALSADALLYQRLLAMDDQEAKSVMKEYGKDRPLLELYDGVLMPALVMAESDRHKGALTPEREEFFFFTVRDILAEWYDRAVNENGQSPLSPAPATGGRILCIPAIDEADELAAAMLAQLLSQANRANITFPLGLELEPVLTLMKPTKADVFCISSVPPLAFSHARELTTQLRTQFPDTPILIGVWGYPGDVERAARRFQPSQPDRFATTFAQALEFINQHNGNQAEIDNREAVAELGV